MIRAVIFDIDNTLYDYDAAHAVAYRALSAFACESFRLAQAEFDDLHERASRELSARSGGGAVVHNRLIRYQLMLEARDLPIAFAPVMADLYWSALLSAMRPEPGMNEALTGLKDMGLRLGIGTNMTADRQYAKLERLGLLSRIDFMVTSEEAGAEKPDRRLFDLCAQKAGCKASQCAFVGDSLRGDAWGALNAGMRALWLPKDREATNPLGGVIVIRSLSELPRLVSQLNDGDISG